MVRILGLDPGLRHTGWGVIEKDGSRLRFVAAGVINPDDKNELNKFIDANRLNIAEDNDGALVFLARNAWHLNKAQEDFPKVKFSKIKE